MFMKQVDMLSFVRGAERFPAGGGRDRAHVRVERPDERAIPVSVADFCYMGDRTTKRTPFACQSCS